MSDQEIENVRFRAKPNAFLYALEATRIHFLALLGVGVFSIGIGYLRFPVPISILLLLFLMAIASSFLLMFVFTVAIACCAEFLITDNRAVVRFRWMGRVDDKISVALSSVKSIEVRSYNSTYGSVYLKKALDDQRARARQKFRWTRANVPTEPAQTLVIWNKASIWLAIPLSSPPLSGFYGFRGYDAFARAIVDSQNFVES